MKETRRTREILQKNEQQPEMEGDESESLLSTHHGNEQPRVQVAEIIDSLKVKNGLTQRAKVLPHKAVMKYNGARSVNGCTM